jgi:hypothetical protein
MPFTKGHKLAKGGKRPGAGRKPAEIKQMRGEAAAACFDRANQIAHDRSLPASLQLQACIYIINRVEGTPTQTVDATVGERPNVSIDV